MPSLQFINTDRISLLSTPPPNGRSMPLKSHESDSFTRFSIQVNKIKSLLFDVRVTFKINFVVTFFDEHMYLLVQFFKLSLEHISQSLPVLRIHDILVSIRIRGYMPLTNGSGSCYFHHWPSRRQQKTNLKKSFSAYNFLKVHWNHFSKIISQKEVTKQ